MMRIYLESLGCPRNLVDSEIMLGALVQAGFQIIHDANKAEVIIVNTCSFIEEAANESIDRILELSSCKIDGFCQKLIVVGCLPQRYGSDIIKSLPEVDSFLGTGAFHRIVDAVQGNLNTVCLLPTPDPEQQIQQKCFRFHTHPYMAYIKIAEGCFRRCSYCIIPKLRGKQKSRPIDDIISEASYLIYKGYKELILVSQETTAYGKDFKDSSVSLDQLLYQLSNLSKDVWIRFLYGHPESIDDRVISRVAQQSNICSYFDIPIQHIGSSVLKNMRRRYSKNQLFNLFHRIRTMVPDAVLRTSVIVGFPGETDKDFEELMDFIQTIRFNHLGVFIYSDSEDLPSHKLQNHVSKRTAQKRYDRIMTVQQDISRTHNQRFIGKILSVLIDEQIEPGQWIGRTAYQAPDIDGIVYVQSNSNSIRVGEFVKVQITDALEYDLIGKPA